MKCAFLACGVLIGLSALAAQEEEISKEKGLQGKWIVVTAEINGIQSKASVGDMFVFGDSKVTLIKANVKESTVAFKLDPTKKPKHLDTDSLGIYELKGDELTLCISVSGKRPMSLDSKQGLLLKFKRD